MSNTRRARAAIDQAPRERCSFCRRALGPGSVRRALRLKSGQLACAKCRETGYLKALACGHVALPGVRVVNESGDGKTFVCLNCASSGKPVMDVSDFRKLAEGME